jgi:hypothetical protein
MYLNFARNRENDEAVCDYPTQETISQNGGLQNSNYQNGSAMVVHSS